MSVPTDLILVFALVILGVQSLALIYVVIRLIGVADKALARAQGPEPSPSPPVPPVAHPPVVAPSPAKPPAGTPLTEAMVVDQGLKNFIKKDESFVAKATWDYQQYTNGYGTKALSSTEVIDEATAEQRLDAEIDAAYKHVVNKFPSIKFDKGQLQALTDLTFNAGPGWEEESLGKQVAAQKIDSIKADILQYNHAGGQVLAGLTARREAEVSWFDHPL